MTYSSLRPARVAVSVVIIIVLVGARAGLQLDSKNQKLSEDLPTASQYFEEGKLR